MPQWKIHDKWAKEMGISNEVSDFVNLLIDFPQKCQDFLDFCDRELSAIIYRRGRPTSGTVAPFINHDSGRGKRSWSREIQLKFLHQKGEEYIKAWYLHHILDYIRWWLASYDPTPSIANILQAKRLEKMFGSSQNKELQDIKNFAVKHSEEILQDCR